MSIGADGLNQAQSRTAIAATVAAELHGIRSEDQPRWFRDHLKVEIGKRGRQDALQLRKATSPWDQPRGRRSRRVEGDGSASVAESARWLWDSIEVDPRKLDLQEALVLFPEVHRPEQIVSHLKSTLGVVKVIDTFGGLNGSLVVGQVVYLGAQRRAQIDARLRELQLRFEWLDIRELLPSRPYEQDPAAKTWSALARQLAELEGHTAKDRDAV